MPDFKLRLEKTYFEKGFFNVPVRFDSYARASDGPILILAGSENLRINGRIDRRANSNRTARIIGNAKLRDWFQANCKLGEDISVDLEPSGPVRLSTDGQERMASAVTADELSRWVRDLMKMLDASGDARRSDEGPTSRVRRLSYGGRIPREIAAIMIALVEMRNATEHREKELSANESTAVRAQWLAIKDWFARSGTRPPAGGSSGSEPTP